MSPRSRRPIRIRSSPRPWPTPSPRTTSASGEMPIAGRSSRHASWSRPTSTGFRPPTSRAAKDNRCRRRSADCRRSRRFRPATPSWSSARRSPPRPRLRRRSGTRSSGGSWACSSGSAWRLLLERLDRRLRQPKDFEETFGLPVLTEVPESKSLARSDNGMGELLASEGGAFQMLRARLRYFNVDRDIHSVLVTSAAPGEGKTTIAWNLAASAASSGSAHDPAGGRLPSAERSPGELGSGRDRAFRNC